jgi:hypothetical protein
LSEELRYEPLGEQLAVHFDQGALLTHADCDDIFLMRLALMEVRAMVCLPQETYRNFVSRPSPRASIPAFERGDETARLRTT